MHIVGSALAHGLVLEDSVESRLASVEATLQRVLKELAVVQGCSADFCDIHWSKWSEWTAWSKCTGQCMQGVGTSEQTRTRVRSCIGDSQGTQTLQCKGNSIETDKRPCNAVELYGCLSTAQNTNNTYGMVYNFFDELAQSTCTAAVNTASHVIVLRRNCNNGKAPECSKICANAGRIWGYKQTFTVKASKYRCFDELHVYPPTQVLNPNVYKDEGKPGLMMYRYFSCTFGTGSCGPNYCCCTDV